LNVHTYSLISLRTASILGCKLWRSIPSKFQLMIDKTSGAKLDVEEETAEVTPSRRSRRTLSFEPEADDDGGIGPAAPWSSSSTSTATVSPVPVESL